MFAGRGVTREQAAKPTAAVLSQSESAPRSAGRGKRAEGRWSDDEAVRILKL